MPDPELSTPIISNSEPTSQLLPPTPSSSHASKSAALQLPQKATVVLKSPPSKQQTPHPRQYKSTYGGGTVASRGKNGFVRNSFRLLKRRALYLTKALGILVAIAFGSASLYYTKRAADDARRQLLLAQLIYCENDEYAARNPECTKIFGTRLSFVSYYRPPPQSGLYWRCRSGTGSPLWRRAAIVSHAEFLYSFAGSSIVGLGILCFVGLAVLERDRIRVSGVIMALALLLLMQCAWWVVWKDAKAEENCYLSAMGDAYRKSF